MKQSRVKASKEIFSVNLLKLMTQKGVDEHALAKTLHVYPRLIRVWTKAKNFPTYTMMVKLCNYFGYYDIYKILTEHIIIKK